MNAIAERWIGGCRRELLDRTLVWTRPICGGSCARTRSTTITTGLTGRWTQLHRSNRYPEPVDLDRYRVRRQTRTACLINEYRLVA